MLRFSPAAALTVLGAAFFFSPTDARAETSSNGAPPVENIATPPAVVDVPHSDDGGDAWSRRPFAIMGVYGVGTPVGILGVVVEYTPIRAITLSAGVGGSDGAQFAFTPRVSLPLSDYVSFSVGGGVSGGHYREHSLYDGPGREWRRAIWANGEASMEGRLTKGFSWRAFLGVGQVLNTPSSACMDDEGVPCSRTDLPSIVYLGGAFGYAFDL
jgi:hypothetical protein